MIKDYQLELSRLQAVTSSAASENYINQGTAGDAYGQELYLICRVGTAFANATSMTITLETDDETTFTSPTILYSSGAILEAALTANKEIVKIRLPKGLKQYFRVYYTVNGTHNAGTIDAFLTKDVNQSKA